MTGTPDIAERGHATAEPRGRPTLEPDERLWLENYLERLRKAPGGLLKRLVVYGSKARGDAGPTSDVDVLVLVGEAPDAVRNARDLIYDDDDPDDVDHNVVVRTEADWLRDIDNELPFPRNVEAEGVQIHPVHRPARRPPGNRPPVTPKGIRHAVPVWLTEARRNLEVLEREIDLLRDGQLEDSGIAARPAFDAVFFSTMAWCLTRGVSVVRRKDLPTSVERHLIEPGVLDPDWRDRIRTLWAAWKAEVDWNPRRDVQPTIDHAAGWAETARDFCGLARDAILSRAAGRLGIPAVPIRRAVLTQAHGGRPACHYCGACGSGCRTASFFNATDYLLMPVLETGRLEIVSGAVAARVLTGDDGRAEGVQYFERESGAERVVRARTVVVAASAMDSTRILLNSRSRRHPAGLGNGNGQLGRNYCEQVRFHRFGFLPQLFGQGYTNDDGIGGGHVYIPRFNHRLTDLDYVGGFGIQLWGNGCQTTGVNVAELLPGLEFGAGFKHRVRERYPALAALHPYGEILPRPDNRVTVDGARTDRYGVPLTSIDVTFGDNERRMVRHMHEVADEILHTAGAEMVPSSPDEHDPPGAAIHEHGTVRMGDDPARSVLNRFNRMHEVDNVLVVDGSSFTSASEKNPTLTILALAWRAGDFLAEELRSGRL